MTTISGPSVFKGDVLIIAAGDQDDFSGKHRSPAAVRDGLDAMESL